MDRMHDWLISGERPLPFFLSSFAKGASGGRSRDDDDSDDDGDDEDDDDSDDDDSDDDGDDDEDDEFADMSEAELKAELKKTRGSLEKAGSSASSKRKRIRALERELEEERSKKKPAASKRRRSSKDDDDEDDDERIDRDAIRREERRKADDRIKRSEAKTALVAAGVSPEQAKDLVAFVKLDELDVDDDGDVDGLEDEVDRIKKKYPGFFTTKRTRRRESVAGDGDRDGRGTGGKKTMTASERQAAVLTGRAKRKR